LGIPPEGQFDQVCEIGLGGNLRFVKGKARHQMPAGAGVIRKADLATKRAPERLTAARRDSGRSIVLRQSETRTDQHGQG